MNVGIMTEAAQFLFLEHLLRIFGILCCVHHIIQGSEGFTTKSETSFTLIRIRKVGQRRFIYFLTKKISIF